MSMTPAVPPRTRAALVTMIVASVLYPLSLLLWLLAMIGVVMGLADAPKNVALAGVILSLYFAYPATVLVSLVAGWVLYRLGRSRGALWSALAPLAHLVLIVAMIAGMMVLG